MYQAFEGIRGGDLGEGLGKFSEQLPIEHAKMS